jgi:hypothetical protein
MRAENCAMGRAMFPVTISMYSTFHTIHHGREAALSENEIMTKLRFRPGPNPTFVVAGGFMSANPVGPVGAPLQPYETSAYPHPIPPKFVAGLFTRHSAVTARSDGY